MSSYGPAAAPVDLNASLASSASSRSDLSLSMSQSVQPVTLWGLNVTETLSQSHGRSPLPEEERLDSLEGALSLQSDETSQQAACEVKSVTLSRIGTSDSSNNDSQSLLLEGSELLFPTSDAPSEVFGAAAEPFRVSKGLTWGSQQSTIDTGSPHSTLPWQSHLLRSGKVRGQGSS
eukprot:GGOE01055914.1.p2 GENE.GGOE01055914.1~~GGOE01055914.1.p2  ORF type:complete len:176 (+),score=36.72 GGOE01055914.1:66-593(+)